MTTSNYYHVIPDSHYWGNLDQLCNYLNTQKESSMSKEGLINYLLKGLSNTKSQGYDLFKEQMEPVLDTTQSSIKNIVPQPSQPMRGGAPYHSLLSQDDVRWFEALNLP